MANTYLTRAAADFGTATNRKKCTISFWLKRASLTVQQAVMGVETTPAGGANEGRIVLRGDDTLEFYDWQSAYKFRYITNRVFRDTSAWYHIVLAIDTTHPTGSQRVKIYINGVQETSFSSSTDPAQDLDTFINSGNYLQIGRQSTGNSYLNGSLSHYNFIDGTTYDATAFGETDTTTGEWEAKTSPSVTYGTNGFFILRDGNGITDQSGEGNDFTLGGGTLTDLKDNPDNTFATLNPLSGSFTNNILSQGNNTVQTTSGWRWRPSTICPSSGKYYAEFKPTSGSTIYTAIGVTPQVSWRLIDEETIGSGAGGENKSVGYTHSGTVRKGNSTIYTGSSYTGSGDIVGVAMDLDNHKVYFSKNGVWQNSGDPTSGATGTGAVSLDTTLDDWSMSTSQAGTTIACNYGNGYFGTTAITTNSGNGYEGAEGASKFNYQPPTGYSALNTKGLNQ